MIPLGGVVEDSIDQLASSNFKEANGQSISRTTFSSLWNLIRKNITSVTPATDRLNCSAHSLVEGQLIKFAFTGGGITALTKYYVRNPTTNDFQISSTATGSIIDLTSSQSGDMITNIEYGFGDGSTTYNLPDRRGIFLRGAGVHGTRAKAINGNYDGGPPGYEGQDQFQSHRHSASGISADLIHSDNYSGSGTSQIGSGAVYVLNPITDGTSGNPRTGVETNPAFVSVKFKVRVA